MSKTIEMPKNTSPRARLISGCAVGGPVLTHKLNSLRSAVHTTPMNKKDTVNHGIYPGFVSETPGAPTLAAVSAAEWVFRLYSSGYLSLRFDWESSFAPCVESALEGPSLIAIGN